MSGSMGETRNIALTVNGKRYEALAPVRETLADFIRHRLGVQADGHEILTVEGIELSPDQMHPLQEAFRDNHGLQCGFCTPGILTTLIEFLRDNPNPTEEEVRLGISGNLCGSPRYQGIVAAALDAAKRLRDAK